MVQFGYVTGMDWYNMDDARNMAKIGRVPEPSKAEVERYGPFKAVALLVIAKYYPIEEPLEQCLRRNEPMAMRVVSRKDIRDILD